MAKLLVQFTGLFFIGYGLAFTFFPLEMATMVSGAGPTTASGLIDFRATYGGMTISIGIVLLLLAAKNESLSFALLAISIILLAMAAARGIGMFLDGLPNQFMYGYLFAEIIGAAIALGLRQSSVTESQNM